MPEFKTLLFLELAAFLCESFGAIRMSPRPAPDAHASLAGLEETPVFDRNPTAIAVQLLFKISRPIPESRSISAPLIHLSSYSQQVR